jgi:nucleoid DNA-binding protein
VTIFNPSLHEKIPIHRGRCGLTREELAREAARRTGLTVREVQSLMVVLLDVITETLSSGQSVFLRGFGCFSTKKGKMRRARDPGRGGVMEIPPRVKPVFKPYDGLKESVHLGLSERVRVEFLCLGCPAAAAVSVVGDWNGWNPGANPMQKLPDGSWVAEISLHAGRTINYSYCVDGTLRPDSLHPPRVPGGSSARRV